MSNEFALRSKRTTFGWVSDPKIPVVIDAHTGARTYQLLIDTGADFSLAPRTLAEDIGLSGGHLGISARPSRKAEAAASARFLAPVLA